MIYKNILFLFLVISVLMGTRPVFAEPQGQIQARCKVHDTTKKTRCDLRTLSGNNIKTVTARMLGRDKEVSGIVQLPSDPDSDSGKVAILFVVDTSKSMTVNGFKALKAQLGIWLGQTQPRHVVGIARFDKDLVVLAKIGSSKSALGKAVSSLKRDGNNTEFYKSIERGIENLADFSQSSRRFLVLMSDGASEDAAWDENGVVARAKTRDVSIFSVGYKGLGRPKNQKASLQHLEKLAIETGGVYAEADKNNKLGSLFAENFYSLTDNGGWVEIDTSDEHGSHKLQLVVTDSGNTMKNLDVKDLAFVGDVPFIRKITEQWDAGGNGRLMLIAKAVGLLALVLLPLLLLVWWLSRSSSKDEAPTLAVTEEDEDTATIAVEEDEEPAPGIVYAYIDLLEGEGPPRREEINTSAYRIGRAPTNDLVLGHPTVSNDHAVLTIMADNTFEIRDVHSANGTFVNGEKVGRAVVQNGDHISVGVVSLKLITQV